jgi:hypothetical protein
VLRLYQVEEGGRKVQRMKQRQRGSETTGRSLMLGCPLRHFRELR